jgi:methionine biosynthesis protein MetW
MSPFISEERSGTVYANAGNREVLALIPDSAMRVLDAGCGAGDNARLLSARGVKVVGVTLSNAEALVAASACDQVVVADLEEDALPFEERSFDIILLSHVLEHLKDPRAALCRLARYLSEGGLAIVAVPNMANWRLRLSFVRGDWRRQDTGPLDRTHLQFWSYLTASEMFDRTPFRLERLTPGGVAIPLWPLRRLAPSASAWLDQKIGGQVPNFAAGQVLLVAKRIG